MRYFLDFEFIEDGKTIDPLSVGIVAEDGREFYAQNIECDRDKASEWVKENVFPHLEPISLMCETGKIVWMSRRQMAAAILAFVDGYDHRTKVEFWGYYADYDWVVLCQLFGTMMDLPKGWPKLAHDLRQWLDDKGLKEVRQPDDMPHNALSDAKWIASTHSKYV